MRSDDYDEKGDDKTADASSKDKEMQPWLRGKELRASWDSSRRHESLGEWLADWLWK